MHAGSLISNEIFKKIVSIGFEFETHDIAKFSLHDNGYSLINTNNIIRTINYKLENGLTEKIDENNYVFYVEKYMKINQPNNTKNNNLIDYMATNDSFTENTMEKSSYNTTKQNNDVEDSFIEYIDENNNDKNVEFKITNDIGNVEFNNMLSRCQSSKKTNNELYIFKTKDKEYSLKFYEIYDCETISGVEYISTYYKPKKNSNIIIDCFIDASKRIIYHLSDLVKIKGNLYMRVKNNFQKMGHIDNRFLFHKPNTNLYYLHTNDSKYTFKKKSLNASVIIPQMTFGCHPNNLINIMKQILNMKKLNYNVGKHEVKIIDDEYNILIKVELITHIFIKNYEINSNNKLNETFNVYLFMILYKLYIYINFYYNSDRSEYFKSYMSFLSRHSNNAFYKLMVNWFKQKYNFKHSKIVEQIHLLLSNSNALMLLYNLKSNKYIKNKIKQLDKKNKNYGDPYESIISYFDFFENPLFDDSVNENEQIWFDNDWLIYSEIDVFTTKMDIKNGILLTENRLFNSEIKTYIRNESNVKLYSRDLRIIDIKNFIIDMIKRKKIKNTKKYRNLFKSVKTKKNKKN